MARCDFNRNCVLSAASSVREVRLSHERELKSVLFTHYHRACRTSYPAIERLRLQVQSGFTRDPFVAVPRALKLNGIHYWLSSHCSSVIGCRRVTP